MPLLHYDLLCPVHQRSVGILHPHGDHGGKDVQGLADDGAGLQGMGLEETGGTGEREKEKERERGEKVIRKDAM